MRLGYQGEHYILEKGGFVKCNNYIGLHVLSGMFDPGAVL